ncbi:MAG: hypothetical protein IK115_01315 [Lachnospiraceae bacterium]|nr:hypothetical protein [Lachnospiraceae bacterium]
MKRSIVKNMIKRILPVLLLMLLPLKALAESGLVFDVSSEESEVCRGDEFSVVVSLEENSGLCYTEFCLIYDTARFVPVSKTAGSVLGDAGSRPLDEDIAEGRVEFVLGDASGAAYTENSGALAIAKFKVREDAEYGYADFNLSVNPKSTFISASENAAPAEGMVTVQIVDRPAPTEKEEPEPTRKAEPTKKPQPTPTTAPGGNGGGGDTQPEPEAPPQDPPAEDTAPPAQEPVPENNPQAADLTLSPPVQEAAPPAQTAAVTPVTIPAAPAADVPKTGDDARIYICALLVLASVTGLLGVAYFRKHRWSK